MLESQSPLGREAWRIREHKRLLEIAADGRRWIVAERNDLDWLIKASLRRPDRHLDEFGLRQILCELFYFVGCHYAAATQKGPNVEWPRHSVDVISSQADLKRPGMLSETRVLGATRDHCDCSPQVGIAALTAA